MCKFLQFSLSHQEIREELRSQDQTVFLHNAEDSLLSSTVSITSMLYCIYRLILLLWV
ncbi:unnamed protein product [Staurois parvus]|uniref:Uncharacterized protein n=1 Tax=Staurois parvus TaxID=386267 RepID=A0ABN9C1R7_9NEOB|nr:unnamed protein product [Staurois parvus]